MRKIKEIIDNSEFASCIVHSFREDDDFDDSKYNKEQVVVYMVLCLSLECRKWYSVLL